MALRKDELVYRHKEQHVEQSEAKLAMVISDEEYESIGLKRLPMSEEAFRAITRVESPYHYIYADGIAYELGWTTLPQDPEIEGMDGIPMTEEAFAALVAVDDWENYYEMAGGIVYNMSDPAGFHFDLIYNVMEAFKKQWGKRGPCRTYSEAKVYLLDKPRVRPDVVISCSPIDEEQRKKKSAFKLREPRVVVEVLSPGTQKFDRGEKFARYQTLPTLEVYLLVSQDEPLIELYRRATNWEVEYYTQGQQIILVEQPPLTLNVDEVYEGVWE
jgi:Uma2 family endonuclease